VGSNLSNSVSFNLHHPSVLNFSPTSATFLDVIEIHGSNFHKNKSSNTVRFGSVKAEIIATKSEMLTVRVPLGITESSAPISVQVDSQRVESTEPFFLLPSTISGIDPSEGGVSTIIKINGANFNPWKDNNEVLFGKNRASVIEASATQLSVVVPTGIYDNRTVAVTVKTVTQSNQVPFDLTDVWIRKADIPAGRFGRYESQGFALNGIGFAGLGGGAGVASAYQDFYRFDSEENLWFRVADYGGGKRYGTASFVIDDYAFVGTGSVTTAGEGTNDFYKYDKQTNSWTRVADFPGIPTTHAIGFAANGKGYLCLPNIADNFWEYDPSVNVWTQKTTIVASPLGGEKKVVAAFVLQNRAFVVVSQYSRAELYEYDFTGDQWIRKNDIYGVWNKPIIVSNNSHAYHHGDHGTTRYNIADDSWEAISTERVPAGNDAFSFSIGDKIYLGSGKNDYKSMWECDTSKL
jgi:hypothetical protein